MTPKELENAMKAAVENWFKATGQKWPPNPSNFYSSEEFWPWLRANDPELAKFVDQHPQLREAGEIYFSVFTEQSWKKGPWPPAPE